MKKTGIVKWYNANKGYGFINEAGEGLQNVFMHYTQLPQLIRESLKEGDSVTFDVKETGHGNNSAINISTN